MKCGRVKWQEADGGHKKRFQYCTDSSGQEILHLRALQGHSGRNPIDLTLQDNLVIPDNFFEYTCHIGCAINLHSITNSGLILGGHNLGKEKDRQYSLRLWIPWMRSTEIRMSLIWPNHVLHGTCRKTWKRHQDTVYSAGKNDYLPFFFWGPNYRIW